jgi:hypothetical protein
MSSSRYRTRPPIRINLRCGRSVANTRVLRHEAKGNDVLTMTPRGHTRPWATLRSHFIPILVGSILLSEAKDPTYTMTYVGTTTEGSRSLSVISFSVPVVSAPTLAAQIWVFDNSTGFPTQATLKLPVAIGEKTSFAGVVTFSDYRSVSGVLYPFQISTNVARHGLEVLTIKSLIPSTAPPSASTGTNGDSL